MRIVRKFMPLCFILLMAAGIDGLAQDKKINLSAVAFGTSTQLGRTLNVNILIESYSTSEDQRTLLEAFQRGGNDALVDAVSKMPARGRISMPGVLGYEIKYIRVWPTATGRKFRLVTDRPITLPELWRDTRSTDYSMSAVEIELDNNASKSTGTLLPACKIQLNKEKELEIETFQNPWRLGNIIDWSK